MFLRAFALQAFATATAVLSASMLLAGFYLPIDAMRIGFVRGLSWASFTRYHLSGLFQIEIAGQFPVPCGPGSSVMAAAALSDCSYGDQVLKQYGLDKFGIGVAFGAQIGFYLLWVGLGCLALLRLKERR